MKKIFLFISIAFLLVSCQYEPLAEVDYKYYNLSSSDISMILVQSNLNTKDTININKDSYYKMEFSYEDQEDPPLPFSREGIDSIYIVSNNTILTKYHQGSSGNSPYNINSYDGGQTDKKRGIHSYSYTYNIEID